MPHDGVRRHSLEARCAGRVDQQQEPDEHGQCAADGDHQRLLGRHEGVLALVGVGADQEEGAQPGELPEREQQQQLVGGLSLISLNCTYPL